VPLRRTVIRGADLTAPLTALRTEMHVPGEYPATAVAEAEQAAKSLSLDGYVDARDLHLVTLDPPGSRDLDQAFGIAARSDGGYDVAYAIADVGAFVAPGGAIDTEAHVRGETLYLPDGRVPLHPTVMSEGAASLLPADGELTSVDVRRSVVRSRAQLDYPSFATTGGGLVPLLQRVGELRQVRERDRGGVSLPVPEQELERAGDKWELRYRAPLPVEGWSAQLSLLTGMAAAKLMLDAKVGLLRTMPPPDPHTVRTLRRSALALGVEWPESAAYAEVIRGLDASKPAHAAVLRLASVLFRGASYVAFDGTAPEQPMQSAVAAPYAHATAPLRRLADRYVSECCLAACAGGQPPEWVRTALPALPDAMADADRRAHAVDRAVVDLAEALLLEGRVGEHFAGVVVEDRVGKNNHGEVQLRDPAVRAWLNGDKLPLGKEVDVVLSVADVAARHVEFVLG
jgi:exoribonuclease R